MRVRQVGELLRRDWYFAVPLAICVGVVCFKLVTSDPAGSGEGEETIITTGITPKSDGLGLEALQRPPKSAREKAIEVIGAHQKRIEKDRESEEAPALYAAMGNLYRLKVQDYEEAARCYELLLLDYPDWPNIRTVYVQLATCYERLGDWKGVERVYKGMMAKFPKESQEYQYAQAKLAGDLAAAP
jgi:tetratricopeptide (TPR) repeat protein